MRRLSIIVACIATTAVAGWISGTASSDTASMPAAPAPAPGDTVPVMGSDGDIITCSNGTTLRMTIPQQSSYPAAAARVRSRRGKAKAPRHGRRARAANEERIEEREVAPYTARCGSGGSVQPVLYRSELPSASE